MHFQNLKKSSSYFWQERCVLCVQQRTCQKVDEEFKKNVDKSYYTNFNNCNYLKNKRFSRPKFDKIFVVLLTRALCSVGATVYLSKSWRRFLKLMWTSIIQTLQFQMTFFYFRSLCTNRIDHASYEKEKKNVGLKRSWFLSLWFEKVIWNFFYWSIQ